MPMRNDVVTGQTLRPKWKYPVHFFMRIAVPMFKVYWTIPSTFDCHSRGALYRSSFTRINVRVRAGWFRSLSTYVHGRLRIPN